MHEIFLELHEMGPWGPTQRNAQLTRLNNFSFTQIKLEYCLTRKALKRNSLVQEMCMSLQKNSSNCKNKLEVSSPVIQALCFWQLLLPFYAYEG